MNASRASVLILEFAYLWGRVQDLPANRIAESVEFARFELFALHHPKLARMAKVVQARAFDLALAHV